MNHRTHWKEPFSNVTSLYNFKWTELSCSLDFSLLGSFYNNKQLVNHFENHTVITNKANMFFNLMDYCEKELGFEFEYDVKDYYLDDPEDLEEGEEPEIDEDMLEEDKSDAFSEWLDDYLSDLSDDEARDFFYNHMDADLNMDGVEYTVGIPEAIIAKAKQ